MNSESIRKQVCPEQIESLLNFFTEHPDLARGKVTKYNKQMKLWDQCAKLLNTIPNGSMRDGKGWSKWWSDWKYRIRRRSLEIKAAIDLNLQPPEPMTPLSELEEKMLQLIGHNPADGEVVNDPLAEGVMEENETYVKPGTRRRQKREHSPIEETNYFAQLCDDGEGPSSPPDRKPRLDAPSTEFVNSEPEATAFLKLEEQKLRATNRIADSLENLTSEVSRMTQSLTQIVDILSNFNGRNLDPG